MGHDHQHHKAKGKESEMNLPDLAWAMTTSTTRPRARSLRELTRFGVSHDHQHHKAKSKNARHNKILPDTGNLQCPRPATTQEKSCDIRKALLVFYLLRG